MDCAGLSSVAPVCDEVAADYVAALDSNTTDLEDAKYLKAVRDIADMAYFESKSQKLDLACGHWLKILSIDWDSFAIGGQLATCLQADRAGTCVTEVLKACLGVKSPSTILKRVGAFRNYVQWFKSSGCGNDFINTAVPLQEDVVWKYFQYLRGKRQGKTSGFTVPSGFLETIRFCKDVIMDVIMEALLQLGQVHGVEFW